MSKSKTTRRIRRCEYCDETTYQDFSYELPKKIYKCQKCGTVTKMYSYPNYGAVIKEKW